MLIRWKSGYVAYWVRGFYYVSVGAATALLAAFVLATVGGGYGSVRHLYSKIAALCFLANLPFALRRRRWWLQFGHQARWLKTHWYFGGLGLTLVFVHSALSPATPSGWMAVGWATLALLTGTVAHLTTRYVRHSAVRVHFSVVVALLGWMVLHGTLKLHHPQFPLTLPTQPLRSVHNVPCVQCHPVRNAYREYTCLTCHVHDTETIRSAHAAQGVVDAPRCLDCHPVMWKGKNYATGAVRSVSPDVFNFPAGESSSLRRP